MLFDQIIVICYTKIRAFPKMMTLVPKMVSVKKLLYQNVRGRNVRDGKKCLLKKLGSNLVFFRNLTFMEQLGEDQLLFVKEI